MIAKDLYIAHTFNAPRERVWQAWTEPEQMMRWWAPKSFTTHSCRIDLRIGGKYLYCMRSPEGQDTWATGVYREIVEMEKIVFTDAFADEQGNEVPPTHYGMDGDWADELLLTVTFKDLGNGKTLLTLRHSGVPAGEISEQNEIGWKEAFDKLEFILT